MLNPTPRYKLHIRREAEWSCPKKIGAELKTTRVEFSKEEEEEEEECSQLLRRIIDKILVKAVLPGVRLHGGSPRLTPSACKPEWKHSIPPLAIFISSWMFVNSRQCMPSLAGRYFQIYWQESHWRTRREGIVEKMSLNDLEMAPLRNLFIFGDSRLVLFCAKYLPKLMSHPTVKIYCHSM